MNIYLERLLYNKYPILFQGKDKDVSLSLMAFGLEVGDGWYYIVDKACDRIMQTTFMQNAISDTNAPSMEFFQVKEKFGTIRIYIDYIYPEEWNGSESYSTDEVEEILFDAEDDSAETCIVCGKPGVLVRPRGWILCLCSEHEKEYERGYSDNP